MRYTKTWSSFSWIWQLWTLSWSLILSIFIHLSTPSPNSFQTIHFKQKMLYFRPFLPSIVWCIITWEWIWEWTPVLGVGSPDPDHMANLKLLISGVCGGFALIALGLISVCCDPVTHYYYCSSTCLSTLCCFSSLVFLSESMSRCTKSEA